MIFRAAITSKCTVDATCPGVGMFDELCHDEEGYGATLKARARQTYGTTVGFAGRGEMIPNPDTYCEIDPNVVDQWGIPVLRFHFKWSDYELRQAQDMQQTFRSIIETMGGVYKTKTAIDGQYPFGILEGGKIIHEVGHRPHGRRSQNFRAQRLLPGSRCEKSFCHRWRVAGHQS